MNRLPTSFVRNTESTDSIRQALSPKTEPLAEGNSDIALLVFTGFLSASLVPTLVCRLPQSHTLTWVRILCLSLIFIALTAAVGAAGITLPWLFLKAKPSFGLAFLSKKAGIGWLFLPCITLLYRQHSPWIFLVVALATIAVALSLRPVFPVPVETDQAKFAAWKASTLPTLYGLPIADFRPLRALIIALGIQGALVFAVRESLYLASILLAASTFLLAWRWSAFDRSAIQRFARKGPRILLCGVALVLTMLALVPWVAGKSYGSNKPAHKPALITHESKEEDQPGSEYVGIILWPPPVKKTEIVPPPPRTVSPTTGKAPKPIVIPFDGQYWYFKAPSTRPGPRAHVAHGRATYANVHSTNSAPLLMEAYQNLGTSIDLRCCSEIDVTVTNADTRPGTIALGIRLADSDSVGQHSQNLAELTIPSSKADQIPLHRPPVEEVLRFPIPQSTTLHRFNEITVIYLPAPQRARAGAKVSIESFTLIPKYVREDNGSHR
jgi:hypothetical protein